MQIRMQITKQELNMNKLNNKYSLNNKFNKKLAQHTQKKPI